MKLFLSTLPRNIMGCFKGWTIIWHIIAIFLTSILVMSGFDWLYFLSTRNPILRLWMFPAVHIGGLLPIALPLLLLVLGIVTGRAKLTITAAAVAQAALIGSLVSSMYKTVTGRVHPPHHVGADMSHAFQFGFLRGGVFWGWPSSHTTIAFAMAVTIFTLLPRQKCVGWLAIAYASYVGVGVSMTIHWFSDFVAGAIIGASIGVVVGKSFLTQSGLNAPFDQAPPKANVV